ncbi:MAG: SPFH domain-containing protein [Acidimicrobiia bacterium]|nr:SPFH domain-containing protein [Acidimicrobiia bacterium]MYC86204.1 SPFH domain-containing protein [Acidimicrobiia bacterium]
MIEERIRKAPSGVLALVILVLLFALDIYMLIRGIIDGTLWLILVTSLLVPVILLLSAGLFTVAPNEARVLQLFGSYVGTVRDTGLRYTNPLYSKRRISVRVRNFETERSKVNDTDGNPIEMAAVVVWKVADTAEASFEVDDYVNFVHVQSESAVRNLATRYPYDTQQEGQISLRGDTEEIADQLKTEIQGRLGTAGVEVLEARITHLAYAPEIASAMLQRQQAGAIIAARSQIVEGAVSMVEMALEGLSTRGIVELDEERKAAMVSNLLVVLCGDKATQPVLNTDTL